jgi:hypothetical protein
MPEKRDEKTRSTIYIALVLERQLVLDVHGIEPLRNPEMRIWETFSSACNPKRHACLHNTELVAGCLALRFPTWLANRNPRCKAMAMAIDTRAPKP